MDRLTGLAQKVGEEEVDNVAGGAVEEGAVMPKCLFEISLPYSTFLQATCCLHVNWAEKAWRLGSGLTCLVNNLT